ncbi:ABC transporter, ATP-binding protein [Desulfosarcina variabilis str. Montpellier]|uniref:ABC transporter ATP-binding protein n=1 Tax=Desulfosarcina variabilis TaxID=2300 RepID=UPI003AFAEDDC
MTHLLDVNALSVGNADGPLISGFDLTLNPGDIIGVLGPSGCGKTTLLKTLAGLIDAVAGRITFLGRTFHRIPMPTYRRLVTYVDQTPIMLNMSVRENLELPFTYASADAAYDPEAALKSMDALNLDHGLLDQHAGKLSGGQMQRISLLRALLIKPAIMLLDEPTSNLDADTVQAAERIIMQYARQDGGACMLATHNAAQANRICSSIIDIRPLLTEKARLTCRLINASGCENE